MRLLNYYFRLTWRHETRSFLPGQLNLNGRDQCQGQLLIGVGNSLGPDNLFLNSLLILTRLGTQLCIEYLSTNPARTQ